MSDLGRLKISRSTQRNVMKGLIVKAENLMKEGPDEGADEEVNAMLKLIKVKGDSIAKINEKMLDVIGEDDMEGEVEECTNFELKITIDNTAIIDYVEKKK